MSRERLELVLAGYSAFNRGDIEGVFEWIADDVTWELLDLMPEQEIHGREGILGFWDSWAQAFSDFRAEIEDVIDAGEHVIVVMHMTGRARGSDTPMRTPTFTQIWTWKDDRIGRVRMVADLDQALALAGEEETEPSDPKVGGPE